MWNRLWRASPRAQDPTPVQENAPDRAVAELAGAGVRAWLEFDEDVRRAPFPAEWTAALRHRLADGTATPEDVLLSACHRDGHLREAAVRASTDPRVAALRSDDWVPQVRDLARARCRARLPEALPVLAEFAAAVRRRTRGRWLLDTVTAALATAPRDVLTAARAHPDPAARRLVFRLTAAALTLPELLHTARTDRDQQVRLTCGTAALRAARDAGEPTALHPLLTASASALRADAVHTLSLAGDLAPARHALTDRTHIVRVTAQAALRRAGEDPAAHYRAMRPHTAESAAGLSETGTRADAEALLPLLFAPLPRTRAAAIDALRALGATPHELVTPLLTDPSPRVCRHAVRALRDRPPPERFLLDLLRADNPPHTRAAAYALLCATSATCRLSTDLLLIADRDDPLHGTAVEDLTAWHRSFSATSYLTPDAAPWADLIAGAEPTLGPDRARVLRFIVGLR